MTAIRQTATVKANGVIELQSAELCPGETVEVIVLAPRPAPTAEPASFLKVARELNLEGPADWSERFDDYLYGNGREPRR